MQIMSPHNIIKLHLTISIMFLILHGDKPIYEYNFNKPEKLQTYFMIHASLDTIDYTLPKRR